MLHVALWQPEIPPNTGNIGRMCAATDTPLHLIGRLGFRLDHRDLLRAGLDYWPHVDVRRHDTLADLEAQNLGRVWCVSKHGPIRYTEAQYQDGDVLLFGNESSGLPPETMERHAGRIVSIPMPTGKVRCINLATAVGIVLYEALRQLHSW